MKKEDKAAGCGDTQTAQQKISRFKFIQKLAVLKDRCIRWAAWLSVVGGGLW